ncbi:MAG: cation-translocating P-type ATPase C-terminal domain-containing protein [Pedobacter sp.]
MGINQDVLLSPIHNIFIELVIGPTCSIIYENEPAERNIMYQKPRPFSDTFFNLSELTTSAIQGIAITIGVLSVYWFSVAHGYGEAITRTIVFITLITSNITLTLVNRSFIYYILTTLKYKNKLVGIIIGSTILSVSTILYIEPVTRFFQFERLEVLQLISAIVIGFLSVIWYESVK